MVLVFGFSFRLREGVGVLLPPLSLGIKRNTFSDARGFIRRWCWVPNFCHRDLRKNCVPRQNNQSQRCIPREPREMGLGIRCWDPNLSSGYQNCGLGIHRWEFVQNRSGRNSNFSRKFRVVSAPALYKNPAVIQQHWIWNHCLINSNNN